MLSFLNVLVVITKMQVMQPVIVKTPELEIDFTPRTPNQISSFYEARGFPKEMLDVLRKQCFITVGIQNNSDATIWMNLSNWEITADGKPLKREHRDYWKQRWQDMDMPMSKQSTFRWTLLPETLDYLPNEREGGNIILPFTDKPVSIKATFAYGADMTGKTITINTDKLFCAEDPR